jgi:hypothetical protein
MISGEEKVRKGEWSKTLALPLAMALLVTPCANVAGQDDRTLPIRVDAFGSFLWSSLHVGELYDAGNSAWGFNGSLALRHGQRLGAEVFLEFTPSHRGAQKPTPQFLSSGAWATLSLTPDPVRALDLFIAVGAAYIDVSDWPEVPECEDYVCVIPDRTDFNNGGAFSLVLGSGITYQLTGPLSVRLQVRLPSKSSVVGERIVQLGAGVGLRIR